MYYSLKGSKGERRKRGIIEHTVMPNTVLWNVGLSEDELFCYMYLQTAELWLAVSPTKKHCSIMCKHRDYLQ